MSTLKRYLVAIATTIFVWVLADLIVGSIVLALAPPLINASLAEAQLWEEQMYVWFDLQGCLSLLVAFAAGAYVFKGRVVFRAFLLWFAGSSVSIWMLGKDELSTLQSFSYWEIISHNLSPLLFSLVGVVGGVLIGERIAHRPSSKSQLS